MRAKKKDTQANAWPKRITDGTKALTLASTEVKTLLHFFVVPTSMTGRLSA